MNAHLLSNPRMRAGIGYWASEREAQYGRENDHGVFLLGFTFVCFRIEIL